MTEQSYQPQVNLTAYEAAAAKQKWRFGMLIALAVLGVFALVYVYYRWFGDILPAASNEAGVSTSAAIVEKPRHRKSTSRPNKAKHDTDIVMAASHAQLTLTPGITQSAIRSPLALQVISGGGERQMVRTRDDSIYLGVHDKTPDAPDAVNANPAYGRGEIKVAEQARPSSGFIELQSPAAGSDPVVEKQGAIEGSVVLQARIDKDGNIHNLQAISGPEILFAAAREAVKEWHFKPSYKDGQVVETDAQITVKFAISAH
jgi:TonB family protein